jgi:hypothetical protein
VTTSAPFTRQVSPFERLHLTSPPGAMVIQIVVEGDGTLDADALRRAVATAGDALPGSRLVRRGGRWSDSGTAPRVRVLDGDGRDPAAWSDDPALQADLRGDRGGPTTEVVLLTGSRPAVVFRTHHSAMDGRGALQWATQVFRVLRGLDAVPARSPLTEVDVVRAADYTPGKPTRARVAPVLQSTAPRFADRESFTLHRTVPGEHRSLVAKVAVSVARRCGLDASPFLVPVDLRRHVPDASTTANASLGLTLTTGRADTWQATARRLREALAAKAEMTDLGKLSSIEGLNRVPLPSLRLMSRIGDRYVARNGNFWTFSLSSLGRYDPADFTTGGFRAGAVYLSLRRGLYALPTFFLSHRPGAAELLLNADGDQGVRTRAAELVEGVAADLAAWQGEDPDADGTRPPATTETRSTTP